MSDSRLEQAASDTAPDPEELARAGLYGLISRLFYEPADPNLLAQISHSDPTGGEQGSGDSLEAAWRGLQQTCRTAYPAVVRQEYEGLFVGVGRAEVSPYLSGYSDSAPPDHYLVRLREQLDAFGLARREGVFEVEDHISAACDVMRWLIEGQRSLEDQQQFFKSFVYPGAVAFCIATQNAATVSFYKPVAAFTLAFLEIERAAFEMSETA